MVAQDDAPAIGETRGLKLLYVRSISSSLALGASQPFLAVYAATLGASPLTIATLHATMNFFTNAVQTLWGRLSDASGRRVPWIVAGSSLAALTWIPALLTKSPELFVLIMALRFVALSMTTPTSTALLADISEPEERQSLVTRVQIWGTVGAASATIVVGLSQLIGLEGFAVGFVIAMISEAVSGLVMIPFREESRPQKKLEPLTSFSSNAPYLSYLAINTTYIFFMSISWPLFTITIATVAKLDVLTIAVMNVLSDLSSLVALFLLHRTNLDFAGTVVVLTATRASFAVVPLVYGFLPAPPYLIGINLLTGAMISLNNALSTLYLLAVVRPENRATLTAVANLAQGVGSFAGSMMGGVLMEALGPTFGFSGVLIAVYILSSVGRIGFGLLHLRLRRGALNEIG
ncbi:MAG: MFS transporter [Thaumarchaeota archaeon]|nr:MFS transporter [Candidatus Calditenuaceae archaeon]MDW8186606.1 MFS transporter [Nitrososphaerota archaeon]